MKHTFLVHSGCTLHNCPICIGGVCHCTTCGGTEGSLPTDCPGKQMSDAQESNVYNEHADYKGGKWVHKG